MLTFLSIAASLILALCFWAMTRSVAAEQAAYSRLLERKQQKQRDRELRRKLSDGSYWIIPAAIFLVFWALWSLFH